LAARLRPRRPPRFTPEALDALRQHPWPGNVRELANAVERLAIIGGDEVTSDLVPRVLGRAQVNAAAIGEPQGPAVPAAAGTAGGRRGRGARGGELGERGASQPIPARSPTASTTTSATRSRPPSMLGGGTSPRPRACCRPTVAISTDGCAGSASGEAPNDRPP